MYITQSLLLKNNINMCNTFKNIVIVSLFGYLAHNKNNTF